MGSVGKCEIVDHVARIEAVCEWWRRDVLKGSVSLSFGVMWPVWRPCVSGGDVMYGKRW